MTKHHYRMTANEICTDLSKYAVRCVLEMRHEGFNDDDISDAIIAHAHELLRQSGRQQASRPLKNQIISIAMWAVQQKD